MRSSAYESDAAILDVVAIAVVGRRDNGVFVGRRRELAVWTAMLEGLPQRGGLFVLSGEAGIGKSRLQRVLNALASEAGLRVLRMRCRESDSTSAYRPLIEAFAPLARPGGPLAGDVPRAYRAALNIVAPLWEGGAPADAEDAPFVLAEGAVRVLSLLAGTDGLVLAVDDVQWADPDTFAVLEHLARTVESAPVAVSMTVRTDPVGNARRALLADTPEAVTVELGRLPVPDQTDLVAALVGGDLPEEVTDFVSARAEGLPLAIEELVSDLLRSGVLRRERDDWVVERELLTGVSAPSIDSAVLTRLARVDDSAVMVAIAVALRDDDSTWDEVAEVTGQPSDQIASSLQSLVAVDLLTSVGHGRFRYRHGLIRDAVLTVAPPTSVRRLARQAAVTLSGVSDADPDRLGWVASLWDYADDRDEASRAHVRAAWRWLARGAAATAQISARAAADRAVSDEVRAAANDALTEALTRTGRFADALPLIERTLSDNPLLANARAAGMHCRAARCATEMGNPALAHQHLDAADRMGGVEHEVCTLRAALAFEARDAAEAAELAARAVSLAESAGDDQALGSALVVQGRVLRAVEPEDALPGLERLLALANRQELPSLQERALLELGLVDRCTTGRGDRLAEARRLAQERGSVHTQAVSEVNLWPVLFEAGDLDGAEHACRNSVALSEQYLLRTADRARSSLVQHEAMRGRFDSAEAELAHLQGTVFAGGARFYLEVFQGDAEGALAAITPGIAALNRAPDARPAPVRGFYALLAAVVDNDPEPAILLRRTGSAAWYNRGLTSLADAVIAGARGERVSADSLALNGYRDLSAFPTLAAAATVLCASRATLDGWGDPGSWLSLARDRFLYVGNEVMRRRCDAVLRAGGFPVPRRGRGDADVPAHLRGLGVTSREMDVLLLVAQQLTNAQIAERLCLSPRTVDTHVGRLIAKAQVSGRGDLARLIASPAS
jgi:DNA-binding CsgD family transcriptional regulator/tetratricopeptide (TPR) repeat protein